MERITQSKDIHKILSKRVPQLHKIGFFLTNSLQELYYWLLNYELKFIDSIDNDDFMGGKYRGLYLY
jgi:hypothetical protein